MCCVSEHRTASDGMRTDGRCNDLYVKADCGHILIFHNLLSSYRTPLDVTVLLVSRYHHSRKASVSLWTCDGIK